MARGDRPEEAAGARPPRAEVLDVRLLVTVAEISSAARGLAALGALDDRDVGLDRDAVVNCAGIHTIAQSTLTTRIGEVDQATPGRVCAAVSYALGC